MKLTAITLCFAMVLGASAYNLLLLDDSSPDYGMPDDNNNLDSVEQVLTDMGISFDHWHNNWIMNKSADLRFLLDYDIILWYNDNRAILESEYQVMQKWVGEGNFLVVTGEDSLGSPNDPLMAELVGSAIYGDCPFCEQFTVTNPNNWVADGEAGFYDGTYDIIAYASDHDMAEPKLPVTYAVAVTVTGDHGVGPAKILVTEVVPPLGGIVVYWNGNRDAAEWWRMSQTPVTVNMFKNMMNFLTDNVSGVAEVTWGSLKSVFAQ
ncbi:MAG TPA: hypothetical protein VM054_09370 [bacterium]|nr:hypothetical protein [bacterium]